MMTAPLGAGDTVQAAIAAADLQPVLIDDAQLAPRAPRHPHRVTDPQLIALSRAANGGLKRALDVFASACGLLFLSPALLTVMLLIKISDGGSMFYGHKRVGRHGALFPCWKFRTMTPKNGAEILKAHLAANPEAAREWAETQKLRDDPRVTPIGGFLRATSLDELPQLWNILVGEMSLVGPRPITREELDRFGRARRFYLLVRPGLTGLWQVSGRSRLGYDQRVELDRRYLQEWSFWNDLKLLISTVRVVLTRDGAF
jgi:exopolysaccharide production protein ExoY